MNHELFYEFNSPKFVLGIDLPQLIVLCDEGHE